MYQVRCILVSFGPFHSWANLSGKRCNVHSSSGANMELSCAAASPTRSPHSERHPHEPHSTQGVNCSDLLGCSRTPMTWPQTMRTSSILRFPPRSSPPMTELQPISRTSSQLPVERHRSLVQAPYSKVDANAIHPPAAAGRGVHQTPTDPTSSLPLTDVEVYYIQYPASHFVRIIAIVIEQVPYRIPTANCQVSTKGTLTSKAILSQSPFKGHGRL
jgi:hypothetical protein